MLLCTINGLLKKGTLKQLKKIINYKQKTISKKNNYQSKSTCLWNKCTIKKYGFEVLLSQDSSNLILYVVF